MRSARSISMTRRSNNHAPAHRHRRADTRLTNHNSYAMNITIAIVSFAAGIAAAFYAPKLWTAAKAWIVAKLS